MTPVADKIRLLCKKHDLTLASACRTSGINYGTLHAQMSNGREIPFSTIDRLGRVFGVPVDYFSAFRPDISLNSQGGQSILHARAASAYSAALQSEQIKMLRAGYEIGTDQVLDWLASQGGSLANFDALREKVDIFQPLEGYHTLMRPVRIGRESLATRQFGLENEDHYTRVVGSFDRGLIESVMRAHIKASKMRYLVSDKSVDVIIAGQRVRHNYRRVVAPVRDLQGNKFTLVHTKTL